MLGSRSHRAAVLIGALLAAFAVGGCAGAATPSSAQSPQGAEAPSGAVDSGADPTPTVTAPAGPRVLATDPSTPMVPGAVLDAAAPDSDDLDWTPPTTDSAQVYEFFRVPESFAQTTTAIRHLRMPKGFGPLVMTINQVADPSAEATAALAGFDATIMRDPAVAYTWTADASGTLIRLKAQVSWIPTRPPGTLLDPAAVTAVTVTTVRQGVPVEDGQTGPTPEPTTITSRVRIAAIVTRFNGYPIQPTFRHTCVPAPRFDTVTFHLAGRDVVARFQVGTIDGIAHPNTMAFDCDAIDVSGSGNDFALIGGDDLHQLLTTGR